MFRYGLIGHPLDHSFSPAIHRKLLAASGLSGDYSLLDIPPETLGSALLGDVSRLDGFNVTIPHKTAILPLLDALAPSAEKYGAANTVKRENGRLVGYNTDGIGFLYALGAAGISLGGRVVVLGCGGAARVFLRESLDAGCAVTNVVRPCSLSRAKSLADGRYPVLIALPRAPFDLLINATPVGMFPHTDGSPADLAEAEVAAVFDAVYNPQKTVLLQKAARRGCKTVGGMAMLVAQAAASQTIWNGAAFSDAVIARIVAGSEANDQ